MMGESKWIRFEVAANLPKTQVWNVLTKESGGFLGQVKWFGRWRRYCFFPDEGTVFEQDCLRDIAAFSETQTKRHREGQEAR